MPLWKKKKAAEPAAPLDVLRWKIVAVNILFAAMVVATLCFVAARQGKNALEEKHRLAFASLCSALEQPILETQTIDHKAIYSSAVENRLVPALFEKGAPIENPYLQGDDAAPLLTLSEPMLEEARQSVDGQNGLWAKTVVRQAYTLRDGSALWFAEYCAIPTASGNWIEMYLFQDAATFRQEWGRMQLLYVAVAAGGRAGFGGAGLCADRLGHAARPAGRADGAGVFGGGQPRVEKPAGSDHHQRRTAAFRRRGGKIPRQHSVRSAPDGAAGARSFYPFPVWRPLPVRSCRQSWTPRPFSGKFTKTWQPVAAKAGDRLTLRLPDGALPPIRADEDALKQVMAILLSNAVQHTPSGTQIELSAVAAGRTVCLSVADTGPGIADKERAFQKFYRADPQTGDAAWVWASIAQKLVALHHGSITIRDTRAAALRCRSRSHRRDIGRIHNRLSHHCKKCCESLLVFSQHFLCTYRTRNHSSASSIFDERNARFRSNEHFDMKSVL